MSYLSKAIEEACKTEGTTPSRKFLYLKLNPSSASKLIKTRPNSATLQILCSDKAWNNEKTPLILLSAHLKDEILRAERNIDEISVIPKFDHKIDRTLEDAIHSIDAFTKGEKSFRSMLINIANGLTRKGEK